MTDRLLSHLIFLKDIFLKCNQCSQLQWIRDWHLCIEQKELPSVIDDMLLFSLGVQFAHTSWSKDEQHCSMLVLCLRRSALAYLTCTCSTNLVLVLVLVLQSMSILDTSLVYTKIYNGIARFPCNSTAFLLSFKVVQTSRLLSCIQWCETLTGGSWTNYTKGPIPHLEFTAKFIINKVLIKIITKHKTVMKCEAKSNFIIKANCLSSKLL